MFTGAPITNRMTKHTGAPIRRHVTEHTGAAISRELTTQAVWLVCSIDSSSYIDVISAGRFHAHFFYC